MSLAATLVGRKGGDSVYRKKEGNQLNILNNL